MRHKLLFISLCLVLSMIASWQTTVKHLSALTDEKPAYGSTPEPAYCKEQTAEELQNSSWHADAMKNIAASEYFIRYQEEADVWQAPNRTHNLRASFTDNGFSLKPRIDSLERWSLNFNLVSISKGGASLKAGKIPSYDSKESRLSIDHGSYRIDYTNTDKGTRQDFIVNEKPWGSRNLEIVQQLTGDLQVREISENAIVFGNSNSTLLRYEDLKVWDNSGAKLPAHMELRDNNLLAIVVDDKNAIYPVTVDPINTSAYTFREPNVSDVRFGCSVASAGDVNGDGYGDVIVGAEWYDSPSSDAGSAFVYLGSSTGLEASATHLSGYSMSQFGTSVASAGDVNGDGYSDVIVGARAYSGQMDGSSSYWYEGAAFIYLGSSTGISTSAQVKLAGGQNSADMGFSVASAGDVNGDGYSDVIVGADTYDNGNTNEGGAFVFHGSSSGIANTIQRQIEGNQDNARMGFCVASAGDLNGDGYSDIVSSAFTYDIGNGYYGAAFVHLGSSGGVDSVTHAFLKRTNILYLGASVASAGDVNGDGYSDIIAGTEAAGKVFIYHGSSSGLDTTADKILAQSNGSFGRSVACAGDVNGDGYSDIVVGNQNYANGSTYEGSFYVYHGSASGVNGTIQAEMESDQANALLGSSVASAGDVNGDGYSDIIVGAETYTNGQGSEGAIFLFDGSASGLTAAAQDTMPGDQAGARFGNSASSAGDVNGDGYSDVIIGAYRFDNGSNSEGAAFVFLGSASGLSSTIQAQLECNQASAEMGWSVAAAGDVNGDGYGDVIVGAHKYDGGNTDEGAAFVYHGSSSGIDTALQYVFEINQDSAYAGSSVSTAGDVNGDGYSDIIVGSYAYDNGSADEGTAIVLHGSSTGISGSAIQLEADQVLASMGWAVACAGDLNGDGFSDVLIGAYRYDNGNTDEGTVFVYHGSVSGITDTVRAELELDQDAAHMGWSVASAGDVNGDGYADVIAGAKFYDNGQSGEGAAFVFHGSSSGVTTTAQDTFECNQASAHMGNSVASAGDVNGDGYSDIIVGAVDYDNGETDEGMAFVYQGSATGVSSAISRQYEANFSYSGTGMSVASAGDVNGDGFSDVLVGAWTGAINYSAEGMVLVFLGGDGGANIRSNPRQYEYGSSTVLGPGGLSGSGGGVRLALYGKSFLGRAKGKLVYEYKGNGTPFSSASPITNSVQYSGQQSSYSNLGLTGTELTEDISSIPTGKDYKWRVRIKYDPVTAITGQLYGPWKYYGNYMPGSQPGFKAQNTPLPVKLISFTAHLNDDKEVILNWTTASELNNDRFEIERSSDGKHFHTIGTIAGRGNSQVVQNYSFVDESPLSGISYYRLKQVDYNGEHEYSKTVTIKLIRSLEFSVYPNPVSNDEVHLTLDEEGGTDTELRLLDMQGRIIQFQTLKQGREIKLSTAGLPNGVYLLQLSAAMSMHTEKLIIRR